MTNEIQMLAQARLHFQIQNPDFDEVFREGFEEGQLNVDESCNPYARGTAEYQFWNDGWWAAFYEEEPWFDSEGVAAEVPATVQDVAKAIYTPRHSTFTLNTFRLVNMFLRVFSTALFSGAVVAACYDIIA